MRDAAGAEGPEGPAGAEGADDPFTGRSASYAADEERAIREAHGRGESAMCPRCQVPLTHRAIGGGSFGLGYSRRREWLLCPSCRRSVLFDAKRGTRT